MSAQSGAPVLIADYGVGNLGSLANIIKKVGGRSEVSRDPGRIAAAQKLILPGVGAFDHGMDCLRKSGLLGSLEEAVLRRQVPVLGICLGMQLMLSRSEEGKLPGLGWIEGSVTRFQTAAGAPRVPHMGWNAVRPVRDNPLLPIGGDAERFYFVHSFKVECAERADVLATTEYGVEFCSAFGRGNIFGVQFHPEKSHLFGMDMFKRFLLI